MGSSNLKIVLRMVDELSSKANCSEYEDPDHLLEVSLSQVATFKNNPYLNANNRTAQVLGVVGKRIVGSLKLMPKRIVADDNNYEVVSGTSLFVNMAFRNTLLGITLVQDEPSFSRDGVCLGSGSSLAGRKVIKLVGRTIFPLKQFFYVADAFALIKKFGMRGLKARLVSCCANIVFGMQRIVVDMIAAYNTRGYSLRVLSADDEAILEKVAGIVRSDNKRFREEHDVAWFKWVLNYDFDALDARSVKRLWGVFLGERLEGFVLGRYGIGNKPAKILDWGMSGGKPQLVPWIMLKVARALIKRSSYVVLSAGEEELSRVFRRLLLPPASEQIVSLGINDDSSIATHEGVRDANNWRIRPGIGDAPFS